MGNQFKKRWERQPNTVGAVLVELFKEVNEKRVSENKAAVELDLKVIPRDTDSTIWVRLQQRKGKLGSLF